MDQLLTIGALGERCGVSRSALRFYDQCGLLRPVVVDETTGYRYYEEAQVEVAELVRRLRAADVPVAEVKAFLAAGLDQRRKLLESYRAAINERLVSARTILDELERTMTANEGHRVAECALSAEMLSLALGQVMFAMSKDEGRPELEGVLVEFKDGSLRLVATDSYRMAVRDIVPKKVTTGTRAGALFGTSDVLALRERLAAGGMCVLRTGAAGGLDVHLDGEVLPVPARPGEFPDYESLLLGLPAGRHCVVSRSSLMGTFNRRPAATLATMRFSPGELRIDMDDEIVTLPSDWSGPEMEILLNANFVSDALTSHIGPDIVIEVIEALRPIIFRSADAGTFSVLVMPVRPREEAANPA